MTNSIYGIGLSGLAAAQAGLIATGHNIANVNTPGYSRQEILQTTRLALFTGSGFFGQGTNVDSVRRVYSNFLVAQQLQAQAESSQLAAYSAALTQADNLFGDAVGGLSPALNEFFAGVNGVSGNPADTPSRQQMVSSANALAARFHQLDAELVRMRDGVNTDLRSGVDAINAYATQIAGLNRRIAEATAGNPTQPPNDLLDQRDAVLTKLNDIIGARAIAQSDGTLNVFLGNGQALVVGVNPSKLVATTDSADPTNVQIALDTGGGTLLRFKAADLSGGSLAGELAYRDNVLSRARNELGRIALVLGQTFNAQHRLGQDLNGAPGGDFFSVPSPNVQNNQNNAGSATLAVTIVTPGAVTASDYQLSYDGTNYKLTRLSDNTQQTFATLPQTVDGITIGLAAGAPAAGDSFLIEPTRNAASGIGVALTDPALVAAATPVRTAATVGNAGAATISPGTIDASYWSSPLGGPVSLTFTAGLLTGFPLVPVTVTSGTTTTTYPAGAPVPYTPGATVTFGGVTISMTGTPADGDTFAIGPNIGGRGDNRNAQLLAALGTSNLVGNGATTLGAAYGELTSFVGTTTQEAGIESTAQAQLLAQTQSARETVSGVNLDEEAANLQKYQQAYQAAGKLMVVANSLFQSILDIANA